MRITGIYTKNTLICLNNLLTNIYMKARPIAVKLNEIILRLEKLEKEQFIISREIKIIKEKIFGILPDKKNNW